MSKNVWRSLIRFWDREDSLTAFLWVLCLYVFLIGPLSHLGPRFHILIEIFFGIVLVSGIWVTIESHKAAFISIWFAALAFGASIAEYVLGQVYSIVVCAKVCDSLILGMFLFVVFKQTMKAGPITSHRIKGAIASYLLIAVLWAKLYYLLLLLLPGSFSGLDPVDPFASLVYFSLVTLTTLGYGDILPTHVFSRSICNVEALIGQLFPAIFIARLVSLEVEQRKH